MSAVLSVCRDCGRRGLLYGDDGVGKPFTCFPREVNVGGGRRYGRTCKGSTTFDADNLPATRPNRAQRREAAKHQRAEVGRRKALVHESALAWAKKHRVRPSRARSTALRSQLDQQFREEGVA